MLDKEKECLRLVNKALTHHYFFTRYSQADLKIFSVKNLLEYFTSAFVSGIFGIGDTENSVGIKRCFADYITNNPNSALLATIVTAYMREEDWDFAYALMKLCVANSPEGKMTFDIL